MCYVYTYLYIGLRRGLAPERGARRRGAAPEAGRQAAGGGGGARGGPSV